MINIGVKYKCIRPAPVPSHPSVPALVPNVTRDDTQNDAPGAVIVPTYAPEVPVAPTRAEETEKALTVTSYSRRRSSESSAYPQEVLQRPGIPARAHARSTVLFCNAL